jgi:hypothetical protein
VKRRVEVLTGIEPGEVDSLFTCQANEPVLLSDPARPYTGVRYANGSGFPIPSKGSRDTDSARETPRSTVFLSCLDQYFRSSGNSG